MSSLTDAADSLLSYVPLLSETVNIPPYYDDPAANEIAAAATDGSMFAVQTLTRAFKITGDPRYKNKTIEILNAWATVNTGWAKGDAQLEVPLKFQAFVEGAGYLGVWDDTVFRQWVKDVYLKSCDEIKTRWNNWGVIGICGAIQARMYLGLNLGVDVGLLKDFIGWAVAGKWNPFGKPGELWVENLRNNSGMHYYFFCLSPMLKAIWLLNAQDLYPKIEPTLEIFYQYCLHPETWPYKKHWPPVGWLQQWIFPSSDTVDLVGPNELLLAAGQIYGNSQWTEFGMERRSNYWPWILSQ